MHYRPGRRPSQNPLPVSRIRLMFVLASTFFILVFLQRATDASSVSPLRQQQPGQQQQDGFPGTSAAMLTATLLGMAWFGSRRSSRPKALVVHETLAGRQRLETELESMGFEVATECNGSRGADRALNSSFDVILLSTDLPILNGEAVCKLLKQAGKKTPTVILQSELSEFAPADLSQIVPAPCTFEKLQACLVGLLPAFAQSIQHATAPAAAGLELRADLLESLDRQDYCQLSELLQQLRAESPSMSAEFRVSLDRLEEILSEEDPMEYQLEQLRASVEEVATWSTPTTPMEAQKDVSTKQTS